MNEFYLEFVDEFYLELEILATEFNSDTAEQLPTRQFEIQKSKIADYKEDIEVSAQPQLGPSGSHLLSAYPLTRPLIYR